MNRLAIYPGSFDPLTRGHEDIVERALRFVDRVIVAVAHTRTQRKSGLFEIGDRMAIGGDQGIGNLGPDRIGLGCYRQRAAGPPETDEHLGQAPRFIGRCPRNR